MKPILYLLTLFFLLISCKNNIPKENTTDSLADTSRFHSFTDSIPCFVKQIQMDSVLKNLSDRDNFLFIDLYPVIDTLPEISADPFILAEQLEQLGFTQTDGGNGNWQKGPRFRYRKYEKDGLQCRIFKAYMYHEMDKDSIYNMIAYEQIECRKIQENEIEALAKFISYEGGSKIHYSKFQIIKDYSHRISSDTIIVGYYFYKSPEENLDTVQLILNKTNRANEYICPNYDGQAGIRPMNRVKE